MKQLKMKNILALVDVLTQNGMTKKEIEELPIYIGNDDELNGIHTAWYAQLVDANNADDEDFIRLINEDSHNYEIEDKAILIS